MFFDWGTPIRHIHVLLQGMLSTFWIAVFTFLLSFFLGTLLAVARNHPHRKVMYITTTAYVELIRNTPALVQIFFIYFGLPQFGILLSPLTAGIIALTINNSAYIAEVIRAGIQSIPRGQWEAGTSIGLTNYQRFKLIIFPQALRNIFPALANQFILIIFGTSLLSVLDVRELTQQASILNSQTFRTMEIFVFVTFMYYGITILISAVMKWINQRFFPSTMK